jgi:hypothetical protein
VDCRLESVLVPENVFETKAFHQFKVDLYPTSEQVLHIYSYQVSNIHGFFGYDHLMPTRCGCKVWYFSNPKCSVHLLRELITHNLFNFTTFGLLTMPMKFFLLPKENKNKNTFVVSIRIVFYSSNMMLIPITQKEKEKKKKKGGPSRLFDEYIA